MQDPTPLTSPPPKEQQYHGRLRSLRAAGTVQTTNTHHKRYVGGPTGQTAMTLDSDDETTSEAQSSCTSVDPVGSVTNSTTSLVHVPDCVVPQVEPPMVKGPTLPHGVGFMPPFRGSANQPGGGHWLNGSGSYPVHQDRQGALVPCATRSALAVAVPPPADPRTLQHAMPQLPSPHNILVIGGPQCGKSTFINAYRSVVCHSNDWPLAPTGVCGLYGTSSVDGYPNAAKNASWVLLDTPGRVYEDVTNGDSDDTELLRCMIDGLPWKTDLLGVNARTVASLRAAEAVPHHKCHQCILTVRANDLIHDNGVLSLLRWSPRFTPGPNAGRMVHYLQHLIATIRTLMDDVPPFVVLTHMDEFGGAGCAASRGCILRILSKCISPERTYFVGCPPAPPELLHAGRTKVHEVDGGKELRKMHQELLRCMLWASEKRD